MKESGAHGRFGRDGDLPCFGRGSLFELHEHEGHALIERQLVEGALQQEGELGAGGLAFAVDEGAVLDASEPVGHRAPPRRRADVVLRMVQHHGEKEGLQLGSPFESLDGPREGDENFLHEILGCCFFSDDPPCEGANRSVMRVVRLAQGGSLEPLQTLDERISGRADVRFSALEGQGKWAQHGSVPARGPFVQSVYQTTQKIAPPPNSPTKC